MLRYATLCATLAVLLLTTLVSAQAPQTSGCGSARAQVDVCYAPGAALPDRAPAKKPCLSCALTDTAALLFDGKEHLRWKLSDGRSLVLVSREPLSFKILRGQCLGKGFDVGALLGE